MSAFFRQQHEIFCYWWHIHEGLVPVFRWGISRYHMYIYRYHLHEKSRSISFNECRSLGRLVGWLVWPLVCWSVGLSVLKGRKIMLTSEQLFYLGGETETMEGEDWRPEIWPNQLGLWDYFCCNKGSSISYLLWMILLEV